MTPHHRSDLLLGGQLDLVYLTAHDDRISFTDLGLSHFMVVERTTMLVGVSMFAAVQSTASAGESYEMRCSCDINFIELNKKKVIRGDSIYFF